MRLLSLESLPHTCDGALKLIHSKLVSTSPWIAFAMGAHHASPRPAPAYGDPYVELAAVLQRITSVRLAVQRAPSDTTTICLLDGWVPPAAMPHPVIARLSVDIAAATLASCGIDSHECVYLRGCPHESFERILDAPDREMTFRDSPEPLPTLGDVIGCRDRLDAALISRTDPCTPFPLSSVCVVNVPAACDENPLAVLGVAHRALENLAQKESVKCG
jgi:hypothetical protein